MRDLETISTALTAAETGHLVFATLHTQSAPSTIDRIIDVFPAAQQDQVRMQLANSLQGIVTQSLLPKADGSGRVCALEILFLDDAIRNLIRQGKIEQVYSYMQTGTRRGMQTMEQSLMELIQKRLVTVPEAISRSSRPEALASALERAGISIPSMPTDGAAAGATASAPRSGSPGASRHVFDAAPEPLSSPDAGHDAGGRGSPQPPRVRGRPRRRRRVRGPHPCRAGRRDRRSCTTADRRSLCAPGCTGPARCTAPRSRSAATHRHAAVRAESALGDPSATAPASRRRSVAATSVRLRSGPTEPVPAEAARATTDPAPDGRAGEKVPFYKREITFGRKREVATAPPSRSEEPAVEAVAAEPASPSEARQARPSRSSSAS